MDVTPTARRKSSYGGACVEVGTAGQAVAVRGSKHPDGSLQVSAARWPCSTRCPPTEIRLGPRPAYVVCHPDLARQVLTDFREFDRTGLVYERVRTAMGNGLASAAHQDHRRQRLVMQCHPW